MAKSKARSLFTVKFNTALNTIIELKNVVVKDVGSVEDGHHWLELGKKCDTWVLLKTPGYMFDPSVSELQTIQVKRDGPAVASFVDQFSVTHEVSVHTCIRLTNFDRAFYVLDQCPTGTRLQYTDSFLGALEHSIIDSITFQLQEKELV